MSMTLSILTPSSCSYSLSMPRIVQNLQQRHGLVAFFAFRTKKQSHFLVRLFEPPQRGERKRLGFHLCAVPLLKFRPLIRFVPEPFSQRSAWSNFLQPEIHARLGFRQSARP